MSLIIFALLLFFILANVYVEAVNEGPDCRWWDQSLSHYLAGLDDSPLQSVAYLGLAGAELLLIYDQPHGTAATIALVLASLGLVAVVYTAEVKHKLGGSHNGWELAHKIAAGFAFVGAGVAEAIYLWHTPSIWLVWSAALTAVAFARFAPQAQALEEKAFTAWIVAGLIAIAGIPM